MTESEVVPSNLPPTTGDDDDDQVNEDPGLSSASLCIQFQMMDHVFRPVFSHQIFVGEIIRGYHPPLKTLLEMSSTTTTTATQDKGTNNQCERLHSTHKYHVTATKQLSIIVTLAPSCESCTVNITTHPKRLPRQRRRASGLSRASNSGSSRSKRPRLDKHNTDTSDDAVADASDDTSDDENEVVDSEFEMDDTDHGSDSDFNSNVDKEGSTRQSRMPINEILDAMSKGLPEVVDNKSSRRSSSIEGTYLQRPLGVILEEYSVKGHDFVMSLATGDEANVYHTKVQQLALWFIETADNVDAASRDGGFWKVLYLFQKHNSTKYSLAGYVTLFHFQAPFKKPKPGYVVRVCQALVLPPYQRMGHGKRLLTCVMNIAHETYNNLLTTTKKGNDEIVEINVEDPAPAFVMLRNRTDYDCFKRSLKGKNPWILSFAVDDRTAVDQDDFFTSISDTDIMQAASKAKITPRQIQIVQELHKMAQLQEYLHVNESKLSKDEVETLEKRFRLMVKKRLNKEHRENLSGLRTKAEKQAFLEKEFNECRESYGKTLFKHHKTS